MNLYPQETIEQMAANAWKSYALISVAIKAIETAGLSVEDNPDAEKHNAGSLYGAETACFDIIRTAYGIQPNSKQTEEMDKCLTAAAEQYGVTDDIPVPVKSQLYEIACKQPDENDTDKNLYTVTLAMSGSMELHAKSESDAMAWVNGMPTGDIVLAADWDYPTATDVDSCDD